MKRELIGADVLALATLGNADLGQRLGGAAVRRPQQTSWRLGTRVRGPLRLPCRLRSCGSLLRRRRGELSLPPCAAASPPDVGRRILSAMLCLCSASCRRPPPRSVLDH